MKENGGNILKIENIVASGSIAESVDLELLSDKIPGCVLNTKRFPGAVYHMQNPKSAALIFASGKIVITGLHRPEESKSVLQNLINTLKEAGITVLDNPRVKVTNMVCSHDLGYPCNLNRIMVGLMDSENIEYEPEVFPGLVCRISDPKVVFLLFTTGKLIITGGTNMADIEKGLVILKEKLSIVDHKI
ncbi:TATA-box-binding protein [Methanoregula sp.]|jgi:transcription initiation factor TFIID TATA-box-binding protein|uniref:TATA-box-binding protein n=1 Tax=Methanoregula sp. TaxID=2052170 RepID=UPI003569A7C1